VHAEAARGLDRGKRPSGAVEADDHEWRLQGQRRDRVGSHARRPVGAEARDDANAGCETSTDVSEESCVYTAWAHGAIFAPVASRTIEETVRPER
jgi:hypothetical protein